MRCESRFSVLILVLAILSQVLGFGPQKHVVLRRTSRILSFDPLFLQEKISHGSESSIYSIDFLSSNEAMTSEEFLLPWTDFQEWALRDNIRNYVISIPRKDANEPDVYILWRNMSRDVVELSGYPVQMLQEKYRQQLVNDSNSDKSAYNPPRTLALLDEYEFQTNGGLSARVYGIPGVADGSRIQTTSVTQVQSTLPRGYVLTDDGSVAYELGKPLSTEIYSLDGMDRSNLLAPAGAIAETAGNLVKRYPSASEKVTSSEDDMLLRLGASTAILLAGATAINMLSHHLTVNVFWV